MEGLYLHNLIFMALVTDASGILVYVLAGWGRDFPRRNYAASVARRDDDDGTRGFAVAGLPVVVVVPWAGMRAGLDDNYCWVINTNPDYFWIIRAPIVISIVVGGFLILNCSFFSLFFSFFYLRPLPGQLSVRGAERKVRRLFTGDFLCRM